MTEEQTTYLVVGILLTGLLAVGLLKLYERVGEWLNRPLPDLYELEPM